MPDYAPANPELPLHTRMKAAIEAAPFCRPKLAVTAMIDGRDFGAKLERAIERSNGRMIVEPKLVEQRSGKVERLEELDR